MHGSEVPFLMLRFKMCWLTCIIVFIRINQYFHLHIDHHLFHRYCQAPISSFFPLRGHYILRRHRHRDRIFVLVYGLSYCLTHKKGSADSIPTDPPLVGLPNGNYEIAIVLALASAMGGMTTLSRPSEKDASALLRLSLPLVST